MLIWYYLDIDSIQASFDIEMYILRYTFETIDSILVENKKKNCPHKY